MEVTENDWERSFGDSVQGQLLGQPFTGFPVSKERQIKSNAMFYNLRLHRDDDCRLNTKE